MGVVVDYVRKFDSRLQIELLRAKRPATFKTPGVNVNAGVKSDVFVLTEEERHILMDYKRRETLARQAQLAATPEESLSQICDAQRQGVTNENGEQRDNNGDKNSLG